ncbi:MAG: hypothetical protein P3X23_000130 [Thermosynechococcus sp. Uc]|uniref:hypothetical protein n=1 Tax=Thermosynechococcus sp. Uc TaxID=3034853 RepID=UPI001A0CB88D|nr:hypothetical protein [Thermosynechococcus sp. Uc]MDM7325513.1 hypothetical protein [Thermosynechococcus sp. Uc]HIK26445.1 hypothetical protein [Thermosynechococcus sp. M46_R2017_013]
MGRWEFLLQKEGDRAWLPLEPPSAEVLEGSYRLMARCPVGETSVEVQITHLYEDQGVPKQRYQRRTHRSSSTGLMGILPFTYLQPGRWEFQCRVAQQGVLDSEVFAIALDVLAQSEEWDLCPAPPEQPAKAAEPPKPQELSPTALPTTLIELPQSAYTIFADETLVLEGTVAVPGRVVIRLRNPVTRDVVQEESVSAIPCGGKWSFHCTLKPLANYPVMVGEVRLLPNDPLEHSDLRQVQAFMVTVLPAPEIPAVSAPPQAAPPKSKTATGPQLPILGDTALDPVPVSGFSLPPQLKPVKAPVVVDLPSFCQPLSAVTVPPPQDLPMDRQERFWLRLQRLAELATPPASNHSEGSCLLTPPQLMLSPEPLVSPLHLKVNLPATQRGCSVKVWITNGETGELIAGPRWLVEFDFYRHGDDWQTVLHIDVPASVHSIALMAIAIDPKTGAESPTVTLRRQLQVT